MIYYHTSNLFFWLSILTPCLSLFNLSENYYLSSYANITTLSMAPTSVVTVDGTESNFAIGTADGKVVLFNTNDLLSNPKQYNIFKGTSISSMNWNDNGLFVSTNTQIKLLNPFNGTEKISIQLVNQPSFIAYGSSKSQWKVLTAVSYDSKLEIYENTALAMSFPLVKPCKAMSFDKTGNYFYYFDNNLRYVIDILKRSVFFTNLINDRYLGVSTCSKQKFLDISVSLSAGGSITIWDDYNRLANFSSALSFLQENSKVKLAYYSEYILTYNNANSEIALRNTNYSNFTYSMWTISQYWRLPNNPIITVETQGPLLLALCENNQLFIYKYTYNSSYIGLIIFCCFVGIVIIFIIAQKVRAYLAKRKQRLFTQNPTKWAVHNPYSQNKHTQSLITDTPSSTPVAIQSAQKNPYYMSDENEQEIKNNNLYNYNKLESSQHQINNSTGSDNSFNYKVK